jgi:prepilin peptidase CpaA
MQGVGADLFIASLAATLIVAAAGDLRTRTIPNPLNLSIALAAIPFWWLSDLALWPEIAARVGIALLLFAVFAGLFAVGAMGGGDVKLIAALALWLPPAAVLKLIVIMSIAGGVLTLVMLARHRLAKSEAQLEVPYGVAIAFGGIWLISEPILNQFG